MRDRPTELECPPSALARADGEGEAIRGEEEEPSALPLAVPLGDGSTSRDELYEMLDIFLECPPPLGPAPGVAGEVAVDARGYDQGAPGERDPPYVGEEGLDWVLEEARGKEPEPFGGAEAGLPSVWPLVPSRWILGDCDLGEAREVRRMGEGLPELPGEPREDTDKLRRFRCRGVDEGGGSSMTRARARLVGSVKEGVESRYSRACVEESASSAVRSL